MYSIYKIDMVFFPFASLDLPILFYKVLLRCYISRVENGHTVPALETLEKFAQALEVPMYGLFYDGDKPAKPLKIKGTKHSASAGDVKELDKFRRLMVKMKAKDQKLLVMLAGKFVKESESKSTR